MKKLTYYLWLLFAFTSGCGYPDFPTTQEPPSPTTPTREPFLWPFSQTSIWNTPIGSGAIYELANFEAAGNVGLDIQHILATKATDPFYPVLNTLGFGPGRCDGTDSLGFELQVPRDWIVPDAGPDNPYGRTPNSNYAIVMPDGEQVFEGSVIARCEADGPVHMPRWMKYPANRRLVSIEGDGQGDGQGASGMSALGGTIRLGELVNDDPIRHVLKINPWAAKYLHYSEAIPGYKWPAKRADSYAGDFTRDISYNPEANPNILMGSLFAIPPDVTEESLELTSKPAKKLFYTLQHYGMYFVEDAAYDTWDIIVERDVEIEFEQTYGFSMGSDTFEADVNKLMQALHIVVNNGPESIGGGGEPIAPLAPPFQ